MIGDVNAIFRDSTPAVNQKFGRKLRQVPVKASHTRKCEKSTMSFQVTPFYCQLTRSLGSLHSEKGENETALPLKEAVFDRLH